MKRTSGRRLRRRLENVSSARHVDDIANCMRPAARIVWLLALATSVACGANVRQVTASSADYADYRAVRVAPSVGAQLRAAATYLQCHSEGAFREDVQAWFDRVEPLYYDAASGSASGMQAYLDALPQGPHAES